MDLGENLNNSFGYAKRFFGDIGRLVILIVIGIIPIVNWILMGYSARVIKTSPGVDEAPKLENYGDMLVQGAKIFFASLIYLIVPMAILALGFFPAFAGLFGLYAYEQIPGAGFLFLGGATIGLIILGVVLVFVVLILLAMAIAHMVKTGSFGKAFALGEILGVIGRIGWGKYIAWLILIFVILVIVSVVAGVIPFVGWLISLVISPALGVFVARSTGLIYNDGAPEHLRAAAPAGPAVYPPTVAATKYCINCGTQIPADAKFCGVCGAKQ